jgi:hypothetical protein
MAARHRHFEFPWQCPVVVGLIQVNGYFQCILLAKFAMRVSRTCSKVAQAQTDRGALVEGKRISGAVEHNMGRDRIQKISLCCQTIYCQNLLGLFLINSFY